MAEDKIILTRVQAEACQRSMTSTRIFGITVTTDEYARYEQIRSEMLAQGRPTLDDAINWASCSIGIQSQVRKARAANDEYAAALEAGRLHAPLTLGVVSDA